MARSNPRQGGARNHYRDIGFERGRIGDERLSTAAGLEQLQILGEHVVEAAKAALKRGVDEVVADAKSRCPVRSGTLRDSIKAESNRDGTVYWISANASKEIKNPELAAESGDGRFYYGLVVEFSPKINRPFLYPALDAHRQEIRDSIDAAISRAVRSG